MEKKLDAEKARAGRSGHQVRNILFLSIALAVLAFGAITLFGDFAQVETIAPAAN